MENLLSNFGGPNNTAPEDVIDEELLNSKKVHKEIEKTNKRLFKSFKGDEGHKLAILEIELTNNTDRALSHKAYSMVFEKAFNDGRFIIIEREFLEKILKEQNFQDTGLVNTSDVKRIGNLSGAYYVLLVSVKNKQLSYRIISVEEGNIAAFAASALRN